MSQIPAPTPPPDPESLELAVDQAIAACGGDARAALKAMIVANGYLETEVKALQAAVSSGYARGKYLEQVPRDRKDWYD
jgi:hypothetical protein